MIYNYVNLDHLRKALRNGDTLNAINLYEQYLEQGQYSLFNEFLYLAHFAYNVKKYDDAKTFAEKALEQKPEDNETQYLLHKIDAAI
jgi:hypothetical protein